MLENRGYKMYVMKKKSVTQRFEKQDKIIRKHFKEQVFLSAILEGTVEGRRYTKVNVWRNRIGTGSNKDVGPKWH